MDVQYGGKLHGEEHRKASQYLTTRVESSLSSKGLCINQEGRLSFMRIDCTLYILSETQQENKTFTTTKLTYPYYTHEEDK